MHIDFFYKNCTDDEKQAASAYVETKRAQLEKLIAGSDIGASHLEVKIERLAKKSAYKVTMQLHWPHGDLYAFEDDHTIVEAVDFSKDKLVEQMKKTYDRLQSRSRPHHASFNRKEWRGVEELVEDRSTMTIESLKERITPLLGGLRRFLDRELGYYLMVGDVRLGAINIDGIIDETFLTIATRIRETRTIALEQSFFQSALEILRQRVRNVAAEIQRTVSLERDLSETRADKKIASPIEEKLDMWQADDDLKFEQFVADERWTDPHEQRSKEDLLTDMSTWLRTLPGGWRETLFLHVFEDFSIEHIAEIQQRRVEDVKKDYDDARKYLKEQLQD